MGTGIESGKVTVNLSSMTAEQAAKRLEGLIVSDTFNDAIQLAPVAPKDGNLVVSSIPVQVYSEFAPASEKPTPV